MQVHRGNGYDRPSREEKVKCTRGEADVVSSLTLNGKHAPAIDIDLPVRALPSGTPGHSHLYIDKELTWEQYEKLLKVMVEVGIVDKAYLEMSQKDKMSYLRLPEKPKGAPQSKKMLDLGS